MWTSFQDVAQPKDTSYPDGTIASLRKVGDAIGGAVKKNIDMGIEDIQNSPGSFPVAPEGFTNACATRLSYVLNRAGSRIPKSKLWNSVTGADHGNYIYRLIPDMETYLLHALGKPDLKMGPDARLDNFKGKKGILFFRIVGFKDAGGHVTLWDGHKAIDEDYFFLRPPLSLASVRLWVCP
jgi:hypothetical protein